ncbi:MAG TPA: hypothetical protein VGM88_02220 [Kofleriaceae bacterium]|jgi:hypothetical protein
MRHLLLLAALCAGCLEAPKQMTEDPSGCDASRELVANGSGAQVSGVDSTNICLRLTGGAHGGHFVASGAASLTLTARDGTWLRDGADDDAATTLEWDLAAGQQQDVVLEIRGAAQSRVDLSLTD